MNFLEKVTKGITGMFVGVILFAISFVVLFKNEGREDLSLIVRDVPVVQATEASNQSGLVALFGSLTVEGNLEEGEFLAPGKYFALDRTVEKFTIEVVEETVENPDGTTSTEKKTVKEWKELTNEGEDGFLLSKRIVSQYGKVGNYQVKNGLQLPSFEPLKLTKENILTGNRWTGSNSSYLFSGQGNLTTPKEGDLRISYQVINPDREVTVLGKISDDGVSLLVDEDGRSRYRMFDGTKDNAIATLHQEYKMAKWGMRILGFILMWAGLTMMFGLITGLASVVPALGKLTGSLVKGITFVVAVVLSAITIWVSMIIHSWIALLVIGVLVAGGITLWYTKLKNKGGDKKVVEAK